MEGIQVLPDIHAASHTRTTYRAWKLARLVPGPRESLGVFARSQKYYVRFAGDEDDTNLEERLAALNIRENALQFDDELMNLVRLQARLSYQKNLLQKFENIATGLLSRLQSNVKLQITIFSQDRVDLSRNIAELAKDMYRCLEKVTGQIMAKLSVLAGQEGLVHHEEQPRRSLARCPDARSIMNSVSLDVETSLNQTFRCILLYLGLIAQGRILFSPSQDPNDDVMKTLFYTPNNLEDLSAGIKSALDTLLLLREQSDNPSTLFKRESHIKLPYEDKDLGALYGQIRYQASLHRPPADF